ncbi:coiled-coil domain-containing protein 91-like [Numida meleagris]|uniref:coiled-coil domain-containing protein 91-like n=1 Tax=Numida meleagris TaxID=8996 RepID=UPI000B3E3099|nr:coiled-coil domain-containing protein 91-like [Numida meleagris]
MEKIHEEERNIWKAEHERHNEKIAQAVWEAMQEQRKHNESISIVQLQKVPATTSGEREEKATAAAAHYHLVGCLLRKRRAWVHGFPCPISHETGLNLPVNR